MGSITHIVDEEKILNEYEYDAWGEVVKEQETVNNRFKFNGQQLDPITQQYYLRARFYNPVIARFTQEDTYRGDGLNLYAYCDNRPTYYVDPTGNYTECLKNAYKKARAKGMSKEEAYAYAKKEVEINKVKQQYQMLTNQSDINQKKVGYTARRHGTAVHNEVAKQMEAWYGKQNFKTIGIEVERYYKDGREDTGGLGSSRIDLIIRENGSNNVYILDIKTGKAKYGEKQMSKNQQNAVKSVAEGKVNLDNIKHYQVKPGETEPTQIKFKEKGAKK